ncbi:unnamed protein product [Durusdinium trenchii]|uniref:Uncharacterized protein n=2 Tax=Durusdinium trenchii TaxID=1381693 RepID=A0ABP0PMU8_9DINO
MQCAPASLEYAVKTCQVSWSFRRYAGRKWGGSSQLLRLLARRFSSRERSSSPPLLPDYLNTVGDSLASKEQSRRRQLLAKIPKAERLHRPEEKRAHEKRTLAKERSVVAVALQPGEALLPPKEFHDPRQPLPSSLARTGTPELMKIVSKLANGYEHEDLDEAEPQRDAELPLEPRQEKTGRRSNTAPPWEHRQVRLHVKPEHRCKIRLLMCKKILHDCLITLRRLQDQSEHDDPLWWFEGYHAKQLAGGLKNSTANVQELIKFLARKQLHIQLGPVRSECIPQSHAELNRDKSEQLGLEWEEFRRAVCRIVPEDVLLRKFLDGELSWDIVFVQLDVTVRDRK